jgi:hypothetical protein
MWAMKWLPTLPAAPVTRMRFIGLAMLIGRSYRAHQIAVGNA